VTCRGTLTPLAVACADEGEPWPLGIENNGIAASRNSFTTAEGLPFYSAATLDAGVPRWVIVDERRSLVFLNDRRQPVAPSGITGDDVASIEGTCAPGRYVIVTGRQAGVPQRDAARLFRAVNGTLVEMPSSLMLSGTLTALWANPGDRLATAVVHDAAAGRYEAFQIDLMCAR
jgi:hypothetical protein